MDDGASPAMLRVPAEALREVVMDVRAGLAEKQRLAEALAHAEHEVQELERKLAKRQVQLDKCVAFRSDVRSPRGLRDATHGARRRPTDASSFSPTSVYRNRSRTELFTSSIRDLIGEQTQEMTRLAAREENLRVLMEATREISQTSDYLEVVSRALRAAHATVDAEKYTLGILNDKKDAVELYSNPPIELPGKNYMEEGNIPVDSATTFGRVVLTGKPLEVRDVGDSDLFELFEDQLELLDFEPDALLCVPIFNVHGILVGVFQVITRKHQLLNSTGVPIEDELARPSTPPPPAAASLSAGEKESFAYVCAITGTAIWNVALARAHQAAQGRIECLIKLNRNISAEVDAARVLDQIVAVSYELLGAEKISLYVRDEGSDTFYNVGHHQAGQPNPAAAKDELLAEHNGIAGYVMRLGQLVLTNAAREHPEFDASYDAKANFNTRQVLCAPVKDADSNILAVICASNKIDGDEFTPEDALYLNYVADGAGIALHKSNLLREVVTSQQLTEARLKLADFVATSTSIAEFVGVVTEEGEKLLGCDRFGLLLVDHLKKELWISQLDGQNVRMPLSRGISGLVATTGETVCTRDAYTHELFDPSVDQLTGYRTTSVLCMPVFEDHAPGNKPKIVAVAMAINKLDSGRVVAFTTVDAANMTRLCREIQFALGRLTLDISFFKVVSDCGLDNSASMSSSASPSVVSSSEAPAVAAMINTDEPEPVTESQIISSLVHKYCQPVDPLDISLFLDVSGDIVATNSGGSGDRPPSPSTSTGLEDGSLWQSASSTEPAPPANTAESSTSLHRSVVMGLPGSPSGHEGGSSVIIGIGDVDQWDFNCLDLSNADVALATSIIFRALGFFEAFRIASDKFSTFLSHVATHYRANPFHNLQHAFQVTHATFSILKRVDASLFSPLEKLSMLVAALCHDIDHPGNNNDFEVKARSQMALTHNDDAVLERHHCRVTFIILSHAPANLLENLSRTQFARARRLIIACILATDMGKHFEKCKVLEALTVSISSSFSSSSSRRTLMDKKPALLGVLLHAADLSAQALPYAQAVRWGMRMLTEFQNQARHEAELRVHVESFMANLHQVRTRITVQMNFINYVLRPVWLPLASLFPDLRVFADALETNFDRYRADLDKLQSESVERPPILYVRGDSARMLTAPADGKVDSKRASKFGSRDSSGKGGR